MKPKDPVKELIKYHEFRIKACKDVIPFYKKDNYWDKVTECAKEIQFHKSTLAVINNFFNLKNKKYDIRICK